MSEPLRLISALPITDCTTRLQASTGHESLDLSRLATSRGSRMFVGEVTLDGFLLRQRRTSRNSFQTYAVGKIQPVEIGTLITVQFSVHPGFRRGYVGWGCCMVFIGLPIFFHLLQTLISGAAHWSDLWKRDYQVETMGLLMLCAYLILFAFGRFVATGEDEALRSLLKQTLEAHSAY